MDSISFNSRREYKFFKNLIFDGMFYDYCTYFYHFESCMFELNRLSTCFTFGTQMTLITSGLADESAILKVANERTSSQPLLMGGFGHRPT